MKRVREQQRKKGKKITMIIIIRIKIGVHFNGLEIINDGFN